MKINDIVLNEGHDIKPLEDYMDLLISELKGNYSEWWQTYLSGAGIYRSESGLGNNNFFVYKTPLKDRKAAYSSLNIHNLFMNNSPNWSEFPKRSVICSTTMNELFRRSGGRFVVIPKNGTKIGVCPADDIYNSYNVTGNLGYFLEDLEYISGKLELLLKYLNILQNKFDEHNIDEKIKIIDLDVLQFKISDSFNETLEKAKRLDKLTSYMSNEFAVIYTRHKEFIKETPAAYNIESFYAGEYSRRDFKDGFYKSLLRIFNDPINFNIDDAQTYKSNNYDHNEVWFDNDSIMIAFEDVEKVMDEYKKSLES